MTYEKIEYSPHAARRMRERGVARGDVRWVLARGLRTNQHALAGRDRRFSKRSMIDRRELEVIYTEDARRICVITVAWKE